MSLEINLVSYEQDFKNLMEWNLSECITENKYYSMKGLFKFLIQSCIHDCLQDVGLLWWKERRRERREKGRRRGREGEEEKFEKHCLG